MFTSKLGIGAKAVPAHQGEADWKGEEGQEQMRKRTPEGYRAWTKGKEQELLLPVSEIMNEEEPKGAVAVEKLKHVETNDVLANLIMLLEGKPLRETN